MDRATLDKLPNWAVLVVNDNKREVICCNPNSCYPAYIDELKNIYPDAAVNEYWVEVARRCATQDLLAITGPGIVVRWTNEQGHGDRWALRNLPTRQGEKRGMGEVLAKTSFGVAHQALLLSRSKK